MYRLTTKIIILFGFYWFEIWVKLGFEYDWNENAKKIISRYLKFESNFDLDMIGTFMKM